MGAIIADRLKKIVDAHVLKFDKDVREAIDADIKRFKGDVGAACKHYGVSDKDNLIDFHMFFAGEALVIELEKLCDL